MAVPLLIASSPKRLLLGWFGQRPYQERRAVAIALQNTYFEAVRQRNTTRLLSSSTPVSAREARQRRRKLSPEMKFLKEFTGEAAKAIGSTKSMVTFVWRRFLLGLLTTTNSEPRYTITIKGYIQVLWWLAASSPTLHGLEFNGPESTRAQKTPFFNRLWRLASKVVDHIGGAVKLDESWEELSGSAGYRKVIRQSELCLAFFEVPKNCEVLEALCRKLQLPEHAVALWLHLLRGVRSLLKVQLQHVNTQPIEEGKGSSENDNSDTDWSLFWLHSRFSWPFKPSLQALSVGSSGVAQREGTLHVDKADREVVLGAFWDVVVDLADVSSILEVAYHLARLAGLERNELPELQPGYPELSLPMVLGLLDYHLSYRLALPAKRVEDFLAAASALFRPDGKYLDRRLCAARACELAPDGCPGHLSVDEALKEDSDCKLAADLYRLWMAEEASSPIQDVRSSLIASRPPADPGEEDTGHTGVLQLGTCLRPADGPGSGASRKLALFATPDPSVSAGILPLLFMLRNELNDMREQGELPHLPEVEVLTPSEERVAELSSAISAGITSALPSLSRRILLEEAGRLSDAARSSRAELLRHFGAELCVREVEREAAERRFAAAGSELTKSDPTRLALSIDWCYSMDDLLELYRLLGGTTPSVEAGDSKKEVASPAPALFASKRQAAFGERVRSILTAASASRPPGNGVTPTFPVLPGFLDKPIKDELRSKLATVLARRHLFRDRDFLREILACAHDLSADVPLTVVFFDSRFGGPCGETVLSFG